MPRPHKRVEIKRVESLSTGREVRAESFVDDFTGQAMPVKAEDRPARELPDGNQLREAKNKQHRLDLLKLAESLLEPTLVPPKVKGMRSAGVITRKDGTQMALMVPAKPLRRL